MENPGSRGTKGRRPSAYVNYVPARLEDGANILVGHGFKLASFLGDVVYVDDWAVHRGKASKAASMANVGVWSGRLDAASAPERPLEHNK
ncbi:hypothetical protein BOTBODRAFT_27574 [Botryobasidium botryosum FD-172 SS1]|uniref:Uncharacterized protein n=1 Tax=Botryobasidium botryosum (strain FD-172 SS1) TaxID=930990 RepID=A0A067MZM9_BOTB1|nr:hypothetical protein BOTBODRAFT_27574 [Botryobasidium botryosum FD-172 SS1]